MNDSFDTNAPLSFDAQLTAWVLGETTTEEALAIERKVAANADLQSRVAVLRETLGLLQNDEPALSLSPDRVATLRKEAGGLPNSIQKPRLLRLPILASLAAAILMGVVVLPYMLAPADQAPGELSNSGLQAKLSEELAEVEEESRLKSSLGYSSDSERASNFTQPSSPAVLGAVASPITPSTHPTVAPPTPSGGISIGGGAGGRFAARYGGRSQDSRSSRPALRMRGTPSSKDLSLRNELADFGRIADSSLEQRVERACSLFRSIQHDESPREMFFRFYGDHAFVETSCDSLSTFAADVDTASYPLLRNYLSKGTLPPKEAVRTEECLNYFNAGLAAPEDGDFAIHLAAFDSPFGDDGEHGMLRVGIRARDVLAADRKPLNLVFVIDRSGSMNRGARMEMVKRALGLLIDQIREGDTLSIVSFNNTARIDLEPTTSLERWKIRDAVNALETGGSTNVADGLLLGYEMAERAFRTDAVNRVILCSDGVANTGETAQTRILELVRKSSEQKIDLTTIGVGMGNHNDVLLEQLANQGNGACHYVDSYDEAKRVFVERFVGTMQTIARDVKIQVEFDGEAVSSWRQLGYENRAVADKDFRNDAVDAGEIGAGHSVTALYELQLNPQATGRASFAKVRLRWLPDGADEVLEIERAIRLDALAPFTEAGPHARLSVAVAQFAEFMRRSQHAQGDAYLKLEQLSQSLVNELNSDAAVADFHALVLKTRALVERLPADDALALLVDEGRRLRLLEAKLLTQKVKTQQVNELLAELTKRNDDLEAKIKEFFEQKEG